MIDLGREFWRYVETREPPPTPEPIELPPPEGVTEDKIITRDDPEWIEAVIALKEARGIKVEAVEYEKTCQADIKALMGGPGQFVKDPSGNRMDWQTVSGRTTFDWRRLQKEHPELDLAGYFKQGQPGERFTPRWARED